MSTFADKDHVPVTPKLYGRLSSNHWTCLEVNLTKVDLVFRYLGSKLLCTEENFSMEDRIAFFYCYEIMVKKASIDKGFNEKHGWWIFSTRQVVQSLNGNFDETKIQKLKEDIASLCSNGRGYFSASQYFGLKNSKQEFYNVWIKTRQPVKVRDKSFIGVGYRDKGHQAEASDGSQGWKELAVALYDDASQSTSEKVDNYWGNLVIHNRQRVNAE